MANPDISPGRPSARSQGVDRYALSRTSLPFTVASGSPGKEREVRATSLGANTRYFYSVGSSASAPSGGDTSTSS